MESKKWKSVVQGSIQGIEQSIERYMGQKKPYYLPIGNEVSLFETAYKNRLPVMLKGPTGCGKTRFLEYMAARLKRPLITVACHEDLTSSDLVGRYLLEGDETRWNDGPLTIAVKTGAICYLDEIVEARKDTTVLIHPLTDDRRMLPIEKKGQVIEAGDGFMLVISYNPGYQSILKDLKQSTKQRFVSIQFAYPPAALEEEIVRHESGTDAKTAEKLVAVAAKVRNLKDHGLEEGVSTRLLVYAAQLIHGGVPPPDACTAAMIQPITDDPEIQRSLREIVSAVF